VETTNFPMNKSGLEREIISMTKIREIKFSSKLASPVVSAAQTFEQCFFGKKSGQIKNDYRKSLLHRLINRLTGLLRTSKLSVLGVAVTQILLLNDEATIKKTTKKNQEHDRLQSSVIQSTPIG